MIRKLNLQMFADENAGGEALEPATFEVNGQQMTAEQLADSYKKLQGEYTKVTQKNSELSKGADKVQDWLKFDEYLTQLSQQTGQDVKPQVGRMIDSFVQSLAEGKAPTTAQMNSLSKQIDKAEEAGDSKTAQQLEEMQAFVFEAQLEKTYAGFEKAAQSEGIEFKTDDFNAFASEWIAEKFDLGEDDDFEIKHLKAAYDAYEAKMLKEARKKDIPALGTSGGQSSPGKEKEKKKESFQDVSKRVLARLK